MNILWNIEETDILRIKEFYSLHENSNTVRERYKCNIQWEPKPQFSRSLFWNAIVICLLKAHQRSGPESPVSRFIDTQPFPLEYDRCGKSNHLSGSIRKQLTDFGGIRWVEKIADDLAFNFYWLEKQKGWKYMGQLFDLSLTPYKGIGFERLMAQLIRENMKGFGPKESRALLQLLGLNRYEIPIDSRITDWLDRFGFPVPLSASALEDDTYYDLAMNGFQKICVACNIFPCLLDAAILASYDTIQPKENIKLA